MKQTGKPLIVFVNGPPGAGCKTQCQQLMSKYQTVVHLDAYDFATKQSSKCCLFRNEAGDQIHDARNPGCMTKNKEVIADPSTALCDVLRFAMEDNQWGKKVYLITGFTRGVSDMAAWSDWAYPHSCARNMVTNNKKTMDEDTQTRMCIVLKISEEVSKNRGCDKTQVKEEDKRSWLGFQNQELPSIQKSGHNVREVDGNGSIDEVHEKFNKELYELIQSQP